MKTSRTVIRVSALVLVGALGCSRAIQPRPALAQVRAREGSSREDVRDDADRSPTAQRNAANAADEAGDADAPEDDVVDLAGFAVHLSAAARRHPRRAEVLIALQVSLADVLACFPIGARNRVTTVSIWLSERKPAPPAFHPDAEYNRTHGIDPRYVGGIEVPSIDALFEALSEGGVFAALLAAGYFLRLPEPPWRELQAAYDDAKKARLKTARLGADALSYFSYLSAAYFGRSDAFPPDRALVRAADPRGTALLAQIWPMDAPPPRPPANEAVTTTVSGFTVVIEKKAALHEESKAVSKALAAKLAELTQLLPPRALAIVKRAAVIVRWDAVPENNAELYSHDGFVDILNARAFLQSVGSSPYALLHEFAHFYEGAEPSLQPQVAEAFAKARRAKSYDSVPNRNRSRGRAYAMTNANEYFAELSKAYFGTSEWFPFTRADLEKHDPDGFRLMAAAWR